jgi:hypothetical protein
VLPVGIGTIYGLLALVAPGLLFQLLRERARPSLEETGFREASRVALTSLVFTTSSVGLLAAVSKVEPRALVDAPAWATTKDAYVEAHLWLTARSVVYEVLLACALATFAAWVLRRQDNGEHVRTSVWYLALTRDKPADKAAWVVAEFHDGTRVWGYIHFFTTDLSLADREISFMGPGLAMQRAGEERKSLSCTYFLAKATDLKTLRVSYEPRASA